MGFRLRNTGFGSRPIIHTSFGLPWADLCVTQWPELACLLELFKIVRIMLQLEPTLFMWPTRLDTPKQFNLMISFDK